MIMMKPIRLTPVYNGVSELNIRSKKPGIIPGFYFLFVLHFSYIIIYRNTFKCYVDILYIVIQNLFCENNVTSLNFYVSVYKNNAKSGKYKFMEN